MFGLTFEKLLIIGVIAVFVIGPERLPSYAAKFGELVRKLKEMSVGAKDRIKEELVDVRKAIKEVANQSGDVVDAAKGKSRPGRKKKTDTEIKIEKYLQSDEDHGPF